MSSYFFFKKKVTLMSGNVRCAAAHEESSDDDDDYGCIQNMLFATLKTGLDCLELREGETRRVQREREEGKKK